MLKYFRIWFRFFEDIRMFMCLRSIIDTMKTSGVKLKKCSVIVLKYFSQVVKSLLFKGTVEKKMRAFDTKYNPCKIEAKFEKALASQSRAQMGLFSLIIGGRGGRWKSCDTVPLRVVCNHAHSIFSFNKYFAEFLALHIFSYSYETCKLILSSQKLNYSKVAFHVLIPHSSEISWLHDSVVLDFAYAKCLAILFPWMISSSPGQRWHLICQPLNRNIFAKSLWPEKLFYLGPARGLSTIFLLLINAIRRNC